MTNPVERAILTVAAQVAARRLEDLWDHWDGYPEIGEDDWERVVEEVDRVAATLRPSEDSYADAYAVLEARGIEHD